MKRVVRRRQERTRHGTLNIRIKPELRGFIDESSSNPEVNIGSH